MFIALCKNSSKCVDNIHRVAISIFTIIILQEQGVSLKKLFKENMNNNDFLQKSNMQNKQKLLLNFTQLSLHKLQCI